MRRSLLLLGLLLSLTSCSYLHVHKMDIDQGNYLSEATVGKIRVGMSREQVIDILGQPVLNNVFDRNRLDYVLTHTPGYGDRQEKYLTLLFQNDTLREIHTSMNQELTPHN